MPYVHIRITDEGNTQQQKNKLIEGVTELLSEHLNKDPNTSFVVIEEVPINNWGVGGMPVKEYRKSKTKIT